MEIRISRNERVLISFDSNSDSDSDQNESEIADLIRTIGRLKTENQAVELANCNLIREKTELSLKIKELQKEIEELTNFDPR